MRLVDLDPRWIERDGQRIGIVFRCPHCTPEKFDWLTCYSVPMPNLKAQYEVLEAVIPKEQLENVVPVRRDYAWQFSGDTFETLTIAPSLDASASGHWHGHIVNGEIK